MDTIIRKRLPKRLEIGQIEVVNGVEYVVKFRSMAGYYGGFYNYRLQRVG